MSPARRQTLLSSLYLCLLVLLCWTALDWLSFEEFANKNDPAKPDGSGLISDRSMSRSPACRFRVAGSDKRVQFTCGRGSFVSVVKSVCKGAFKITTNLNYDDLDVNQILK